MELARAGSPRARRVGRRLVPVLVGVLALAALPASASAQLPTTNDPRVGLTPGFENPGTAARGMQHLANRAKPPGFFDPSNPGAFGFLTSDMAFQGDFAFVGGFNVLYSEHFKAQLQAEHALRPGDETSGFEYSLQLATRF